MNEPTNPLGPGGSPQPPGEGQDSWQEVLGGFPRHLTTELLDQESSQRFRRETLGGWVLGLALALFALALPQERLLWSVVGEDRHGLSLVSAFWDRVLPALAASLGCTSELLALLFSALCYGACLPVALSFGRRLGIAFAPTLLASSLVLFSPAGWISGTSPGLGSLALLLGLLFMRELWRDGALRPWLLAMLWTVGSLAYGALILCLDAALGSIRSRAPGQAARSLTRRMRIAAILLFLLGSFGLTRLLVAVPATSLATDMGATDGWLDSVIRAYVPGLALPASLPSALASMPGALLDLALFLGALLIGFGGLLFVKREEAEEPPPAWLWMWIGLPLALAFLWSPLHVGDPTTWLWLLPPALIGCLDLIARQDPKPAVMGAGVALALQLGLVAGILRHRALEDPLADWRAAATETLNPEDWILTASATHHYLLTARWGVQCRLVRDADSVQALADEARAVARSGRRIVLDIPQDEVPHALASMEQELHEIPDLLIFRVVPGR